MKIPHKISLWFVRKVTVRSLTCSQANITWKCLKLCTSSHVVTYSARTDDYHKKRNIFQFVLSTYDYWIGLSAMNSFSSGPVEERLSKRIVQECWRIDNTVNINPPENGWLYWLMRLREVHLSNQDNYICALYVIAILEIQSFWVIFTTLIDTASIFCMRHTFGFEINQDQTRDFTSLNSITCVWNLPSCDTTFSKKRIKLNDFL